VDAFWRRNNTSSQSTDACYLDLVWRVLVLHPDVVVGTVLDGAIDVYVAPQRSSKKDKSSKKQETELDTSPQLLQIDQTELDSKTQSDLAAHYGDTLRMAVKPALILSTISGFHTRVRDSLSVTSHSHVQQPNKLSGMVYTCLQLVTREREKGISVVDIGQKTGYDQKTCFYLVKQLLELDLV
jgi:oxalate---CoA ligase